MCIRDRYCCGVQLAPDWPLKQEFIANWKAVTNYFVEKKGQHFFFETVLLLLLNIVACFIFCEMLKPKFQNLSKKIQ